MDCLSYIPFGAVFPVQLRWRSEWPWEWERVWVSLEGAQPSSCSIDSGDDGPYSRMQGCL